MPREYERDPKPEDPDPKVPRDWYFDPENVPRDWYFDPLYPLLPHDGFALSV